MPPGFRVVRDSEPSIATVLALFRVVPAPLSSAGVLGGYIPAMLGDPHCSLAWPVERTDFYFSKNIAEAGGGGKSVASGPILAKW